MARSSFFSSLPKFRRGSFALFITTAIVSAMLSDQPLAARLILVPAVVLEGTNVWSPLTTNFIYPEGSLTMLLGTAFIQWFIGSEIEGFWGTRKYLTLVVGAGIAGHLTSVVLATFVPSVGSTAVGGMTAIDMAAVTAFGVVYGKRPLRLLAAIPLKARGLAILVLAMTVLGPLVRGAPWPYIVPWLVAIGIAALITTQPWKRLRDSGKLGGSNKPKKRHLKVVRPDPKLLN